MTHEEGLRGRYRRDLVRVKLQLEGDLMRKKKVSCQRFFRRSRVAREKREVEVRGRTEPLQCSRCISGAMADDVSIADDVQFCTLESTATRHEQIGCAPPRTSPAERSARKNEDPQFELRFPGRGSYRFGRILTELEASLPPLCSMHIPLEQSPLDLYVRKHDYNIVRLRIG